MATIKTNICDRCGAEIKHIGWTALLKKPKTRLRVLELLNGNPDGYSYSEWDYELCADCTKKLGYFLRGKELQK